MQSEDFLLTVFFYENNFVFHAKTQIFFNAMTLRDRDTK